MKRWRWCAGGVLSGLVLASAFGSPRLTCQAAETAASAAAGTAREARPDDGKLRIIAFGAHPDDCEIFAGGTACLWAAQGHHVKFVSATNGDIGHWQTAGGPLAQRRLSEVQAAAKILGNTVQVLDIHDGEIEPTLENRRTFVRLIRSWNADLVITHRTNDYHPDHRYTGILVQDAAYMVTVPFFCPDIPPLEKNPVFLYASDGFQKPNPFRPDVVVSIDTVIERKLDALAEIVSQFIEGGCGGGPDSMPRDAADLKARQTQLKQGWLRQRNARIADAHRDKLIALYGEEAGKQVKYAEAFEICEYGRRPNVEELRKLFPIAPARK
jgi:LmbE family N-acetylglucosaminyl deacetylase